MRAALRWMQARRYSRCTSSQMLVGGYTSTRTASTATRSSLVLCRRLITHGGRFGANRSALSSLKVSSGFPGSTPHRSFTTTYHQRNTTQPNEEQNSAREPIKAPKPQRTLPKGIVITGGTSGIGYAVARSAILSGASHVRIITRDEQRGQEAILKLRSETSTNATLDHVTAETQDYADSKLFATPTHPLTTIIHCAGITQTSLLTSTRAEDISKILTVNLESSALLSKAILKRYLQACTALSRQPQRNTSPTPSWQIVNISSLLALKRGQGSAVYAASKAGLIGLTRAVALEGAEITRRYGDVAPGFRANVVVPGYIETPMTKAIAGSSRQKLLEEIPAGRFGTSDEVADAVVFLLGNEYANNCVLNLDGGLSAT